MFNVHTIDTLDNCVCEVRKWMQINFLKLNDERTELIIFSTKCTLRNFINLKVNIGDHEVSSKEHVRNLGVKYDSKIAPLYLQEMLRNAQIRT